MSITITSAGVSAPLSRPDMVIATWFSPRRIEKLLLVAGVQPSAASCVPVCAIARAHSARRRESASAAGGGDDAWAEVFMQMNLARRFVRNPKGKAYDRRVFIERWRRSEE